jgi:hypothetical protein
MRGIAAALAASILLLAPISAAVPGREPARSPGPVSVSITFPSNGTEVGGFIIVRGTADGPAGLPLTVSITIDGGVTYPVQGNTSWSFSWSTNPVKNGSHIVQAVATDGVDEASDQVSVLVANAPPPVSIQSHSPEGLNLSLAPGAAIAFSIVLSGPLGGSTIGWLEDGIPVPGQEGLLSFNFSAPSDFTGSRLVEVRLVRNGSRLDSVLWNMTAFQPNRPPRLLAFTPGEGNLSLQQEDTVEFGIMANDPDGDPLDYTWLLDGTAFVSGINLSSAAITFNESGDHCVTAFVSDGKSSMNVTWNVSVQGTPVASALDFVPCLVYIVVGLFLGIWYGMRTRRAPRPRPS